MRQTRILIVGKDVDAKEGIRKGLGELGYAVCGTAENGDQAFSLAVEKGPGLALVNTSLAGYNQAFIVASNLQQQFNIPVIYFTSNPDEEILSRAADTFPYGYLIPPFKNTALAASIRIALARHSFEKKRINAQKQWDEQGKMIGSTHVFHDISKRVQSERELANEYGFMQTVLDSIADSVMVINAENHEVIILNKAARAGDRQALHRKGDQVLRCYQVSHGRSNPCSGQEHSCPLATIRQTKKETTVVHAHYRADGRPFSVELRAAPVFNQQGSVIGVVEVGRDIDERLRLERERQELQARLFKQQKEESIYTLAGGIAHDFNNLLMSVLGNAELLQLQCKKEDMGEVKGMSDEIVWASKQMAKLTMQLLGYARGGKYVPRIVDLGAAVDQALRENAAVRAEGVRVEVHLEDEMWPIYADMDQLVQAFSGIITNSFEAIGRDGLFEVRAHNIVRNSWVCSVDEQHPSGEYVLLQFIDDGPGIEKSLRDKIFEPFFTTKFVGRGLGLAAASGIIRNHGGCISVESEVGKGVTVNVFLPRFVRIHDRDEPERVSDAGGDDMGVLVVDDDKNVQTLLKNILQREGFRVLTADSGTQALSMLSEQAKNILLLILDCRMDDIEGRQVYKVLKKMDNKMPVLFVSGYDRETALLGVELAGVDSFMQKPFQAKQLLLRIRNMLYGRQTAETVLSPDE